MVFYNEYNKNVNYGSPKLADLVHVFFLFSQIEIVHWYSK